MIPMRIRMFISAIFHNIISYSSQALVYTYEFIVDEILGTH